MCGKRRTSKVRGVDVVGCGSGAGRGWESKSELANEKQTPPANSTTTSDTKCAQGLIEAEPA